MATLGIRSAHPEWFFERKPSFTSVRTEAQIKAQIHKDYQLALRLQKEEFDNLKSSERDYLKFNLRMPSAAVSVVQRPENQTTAQFIDNAVDHFTNGMADLSPIHDMISRFEGNTVTVARSSSGPVGTAAVTMGGSPFSSPVQLL